MPCSCFGKKDKKGGGPLKKEDEGYHPGDFRERDPLVKAGSGLTPPFAEVKKQQQQQQLGSAPPAPVTPPSTPSAGETRLRPEDDTDKATRRRDVVASFYSDQCELIGFKTTGSRPSSAHVGGGHHDGPAATSSPATSSPSSTRSAGACCRADLAEKRREFFKDLANDDFRGSRPTSRLTDPGSQQTPRNSHYQEQLHHTLPHHNKTSRSNLVSSHPLVLALGIHRNSNPVSSSNSEENQNFSLQSSPSPEQAPKMLRVNPDLSVSKNLNHPSNEVVSEYKLHDDISSKTPLLSGNEEASQIICDTSMSTTVQKCSPEISHNSVDQSFPGTEHISMESKSPELINVHPTEITVDKVEIKSSDTDSFLSTEPFGSVRTSVVNSPDVICDMLVTENSKSVDAPSDSKKQFHVMDAATSQNPQLTLGSSCNGGQEMGMDVSVPESDPFIDNEDLTFVVDNSQMTFSSANVNPFAQFGTPDSVVESYSGECVVTPESLGDHQFSNKFSHETQLQTDLFDNKALKDSLPKEYEHSSFEVIPQMEEGPQTIVETTRQFISASSESPIQPNNSQTIVETTRQFITGPPEEQATKTIVEVTRQFPPENSDELKSSQTIVETTRQFISGIPEDEQTPFILEDAAQQFMSEIPGNQINVKTTENFVSGSPDGRITHTIVQTTQHLVSGSPDEQVTQTVVESSEQLFPSSNDKFFLTSVEELDDIPEKFMLQTGSATVTSSSTVTEKPVLSTRTQLTDLSEEKDKPQLPDVPCFGVPPPPPSPPSPFEEDPFSEDLFTSPVTVPITPVEGEPMPPVPPLSNVEPESPQFTSSVFDEEKDFAEFSSASFELPLPQHDNQEKEILDTPSRPNLEDLQQLLPSSSPSPPLLSKENKQLCPTSTPTEDNFLPTPPTPPTEKKMEATLLSSSICTTTTTNTTVSSTPNVTCGVEIVSTSTLDDDGLGSEIDDALESIEGLSEEELVNIMAGELASLVSRLETAVERLEKVGSVSGKAASGGASTGGAQLNTQAQEERRDGLIWGEECTVPYVVAYDELLSGPFKIFMDCSNQIGGDVASIAKLVQETFINQRAFLVMASKSQRPLDSELPQVLEPTGKKIQEVIAFRESKRQSPLFNHLSAVSESIPGLSWVAVAPAPGPYVKEMGDSAIFYTNRVLKEYREKDKLHVEWVQNWNNVFKELQSYVLAHHTTGLSWNTRGGNAMNNLKPAPANCGVPPPPPPGNIPPPPPMVKLEPKVIPAEDGRAALFESINRGTDITSGLKKVGKNNVTDDMKTHKNPNLREGPKPFVKASSGAPASDKKESSPTARPPKLALEGKKWYVEYQQDKPNLLISQTRMDQCVYIFRCVNTVVQIKGKVNSVILDSCKKSSIVFDNLVSSAEVVNCQSCQVQVMGVMPTLSIEKTDGCQVYLSKESLKTEIISAKSTEMNVLIPNDDGDFTECAIPEQFKTVVKGRSLSTTCTEAAG